LDKIDMIFTVLFVVGTVITLILIYYYNNRHEYEAEDEIDEFEVEVFPDKKELYKSNDTFDWNLYESDLKYDYDKFAGCDVWSSKEKAEERIKVLKSEYEKSKSSIDINMLESMMLVEKFGEDIVLDSNGVYRIKEINLDNFIETLDYDLETIKMIAALKDELNFSIENYEIDAKKIFYVMRNAKSLGFNNMNNNSQFFLFAKKHNNTTLDAELILNDEEDEVSKITIATIGFGEEVSAYESNHDFEKNDNVLEIFQKLVQNML